MKKKNKVSVIVPVYNVEKYLDRCLDSLVNQTYDNIEIIVVNDCSLDNSEKIIKKYMRKYKNIVYLKNIKNSGLSFSRNVGLDKATGDYIGFIDSDDYVLYNYYESLISTIIKENADVAVCDINVVSEFDNTSSRCICGTKDNNKIDFVNNGLAASACNKLFKKDSIEKYKFEVGKVNEDISVVIPIMVNAFKVSYNAEVFYNYVQRKNSIQNSIISEKKFDIFYGVKQTLERIAGCDGYLEYRDAIVYQQLFMFYIFVLPKEPSILRRTKWFKKFKKLSNEYDIKNNKYFSEFLSNQGRKYKIYYSILFNLNNYGFSFLSSLLVQFFNFLKKLINKNVIKKNIQIDDLINLSIKQSKMKNNSISISVVIPNYNYEKFLLQRMYSVLSQTVKINEIIILDDCSSDNSRTLIDEITEKLSTYVNIRKEYNTVNSGSAFKQWEKGMNLACYDYIWIAEADDYCDRKMLQNLIKPIMKNRNIKISYCDTSFISTNGSIMLKSIVSEIDIMKTGHWKHSYVIDGKSEYQNYSFLNCTIANVSSCIIKRDNYDKEFKLSGNYKQAGDWLFYVNVMHDGYVSYCSKTLNYYRVHGNNVSSTIKKQSHLDEIIRIHEYYEKIYGLNTFQKAEIEKRYNFLKSVWKI